MDPKLISATEVPQELEKPILAVGLTQKGLEVPLEAGEGRLFLLIRQE